MNNRDRNNRAAYRAIAWLESNGQPQFKRKVSLPPMPFDIVTPEDYPLPRYDDNRYNGCNDN